LHKKKRTLATEVPRTKRVYSKMKKRLKAQWGKGTIQGRLDQTGKEERGGNSRKCRTKQIQGVHAEQRACDERRRVFRKVRREMNSIGSKEGGKGWVKGIC